MRFEDGIIQLILKRFFKFNLIYCFYIPTNVLLSFIYNKNTNVEQLNLLDCFIEKCLMVSIVLFKVLIIFRHFL